jgi:hypothetical protein
LGTGTPIPVSDRVRTYDTLVEAGDQKLLIDAWPRGASIPASSARRADRTASMLLFPSPTTISDHTVVHSRILWLTGWPQSLFRHANHPLMRDRACRARRTLMTALWKAGL